MDEQYYDLMKYGLIILSISLIGWRFYVRNTRMKVFEKYGFVAIPDKFKSPSVLNLLKTTFLFVKGTMAGTENYFHNKNKEFVLTYVISSSGNINVKYDRLLYIFRLSSEDLPKFVIESLSTQLRIAPKDIIAGGFEKLPNHKKSYIKSDELERTFEVFGKTIEELLVIYPKLCVEVHGEYLIVYQNSTNVKNKPGGFYDDLINAFSPWLYKEPLVKSESRV